MDNLLAAFAAAVRRHPERVALVDGRGRELSFAEMADRVEGFAAVCARRGLGKGDRALVAMPVGLELYVALAGLWRVGAAAVFPEPALGLAGLRHAVRTTRPGVFVAAGWYRWLRWLVPGLVGLPTLSPSSSDGGVPPPRRDDPHETAVISFTSGSTGTPKAIARSHAFMMAQYRAVAPLLESEAVERDLVAFPLFVLVNLAAGRTSVLPDWKLSAPHRVSASDLLAWVSGQRVTRLLLPPVLCQKLADADMPIPAQSLFTGGGPVYPDIVQCLMERNPGLRVVSVYGSTEAEPISHLDAADISDADWQAMRDGKGLLAGKPVDSIALRIVDGEIVVAGPHVNRGYLDPDQDRDTKRHENGTTWHGTGDGGRLDDQGRLWLLGRCHEMAGVASPLVVETAARYWRGVRRAAVCGETLAVEGDSRHIADWVAFAAAFGITDVRHLARIPMDRRHGSKVDIPRLRAMLG
jgi:olefin beta-lactone synthetase